MPELVLRVEDLTKSFPLRGGRGATRAVDGINFDIAEGETLALVGESGCGKSTTARLASRLMQPTSGRVLYEGMDVTRMGRRQLRRRRSVVQMVFQDPFTSLDPSMTVHDLVAEPLRVQGRYRTGDRKRVDMLLERVGIDPSLGSRRPTTLSGGQRQRVGIARSLALEPKLVVLDEPVSALDASIQAQVLNLLEELQRELGIAYLFISHDLAVVRHIASRVMVMYMGRIVEAGTNETLFAGPEHPYTQGLLAAVPLEHPALRSARGERLSLGEPGDAAHPPSGCRYRTRCFKAQDACALEDPVLIDRETGVACLFPERRSLSSIRPALAITTAH